MFGHFFILFCFDDKREIKDVFLDTGVKHVQCFARGITVIVDVACDLKVVWAAMKRVLWLCHPRQCVVVTLHHTLCAAPTPQPNRYHRFVSPRPNTNSAIPAHHTYFDDHIQWYFFV